MKYCSKCGSELVDDAVICTSCGCSQENKSVKVQETDGKSIGWGILGFFFPMVGLILYLVWRDNTPLKAKSAGMGALISVIAELLLAVVLVLIYVILFVVVFGVSLAAMPMSSGYYI